MIVVLGVLIGFVLSTAVRFVWFQDTATHYHANFMLYIDGERDMFDSFAFYEEVAACSAHDSHDPKLRVHMHDHNPALVHVHADGVTWGHFFANLGYNLGRQSIETETGIYVDGQDDNELTFILNGQKVASPMNQVIRSEDKLLINYGTEDDAELQTRAAAIPDDAGEANTKPDPAACAGAHETSWLDRLKWAIGLPTAGH